MPEEDDPTSAIGRYTLAYTIQTYIMPYIHHNFTIYYVFYIFYTIHYYYTTSPYILCYTCATGRGWKSTYLTDNKQGAEEALLKLNTQYEWLSDGTLKTITAILPAIREDNYDQKRSQEKVFFNSMVAAFTGMLYMCIV